MPTKTHTATFLTPPIREVLDRLYELHGHPIHPGPDDLLGTLIQAILSQSTNNANSDRAFQGLLDRFAGDWGRIRTAPIEHVIEAIAPGGLSRQKAPRIQAILETLQQEHGECSLEFLRTLPVEEARSILEGFGGVGPKTATFTLMWADQAPLFAMDTHILRICKRLGWIESTISGARAHEQMAPHIPDGEHFAAHIVLIRHGRSICHARSPDCASCPLLASCPHGKTLS